MVEGGFAHKLDKPTLVMLYAAFGLATQIAHQQLGMIVYKTLHEHHGYLAHVYGVGVGGHMGRYRQLVEEGKALAGLQIRQYAVVGDEDIEVVDKGGHRLAVAAMAESHLDVAAHAEHVAALGAVGDVGQVVEIEQRIVGHKMQRELFGVEPTVAQTLHRRPVARAVSIKCLLGGYLLQVHLHNQRAQIRGIVQ